MNSPPIFFAKKLLGTLLLPPILPLVIICVGLLIAWKKRSGLTLAWIGLIVALMLAMPATVHWIVAPLETAAPIQAEQLKQVQAIVILGGGQRRDATEYGRNAPNRLTLERLRYGARLARQNGLPVLVSGGAPTGTVPEADTMAEALKNDFGIPVRWTERESLDTADNARLSVPMLKAAHVEKIALVTHASHMRRAEAEFRHAGIEVIPAPTVFFKEGPNGEEFFDYIPSMTSLYASWYACHEWTGIAAQKLRYAMGKD